MNYRNYLMKCTDYHKRNYYKLFKPTLNIFKMLSIVCFKVKLEDSSKVTIKIR
jgi:hypothetical protein